jgi:hypothetical protein
MALPWGRGRRYLDSMEFRLQPVFGGYGASGGRVNAELHTFADTSCGEGDGYGINGVGLGGGIFGGGFRGNNPSEGLGISVSKDCWFQICKKWQNI